MQNMYLYGSDKIKGKPQVSEAAFSKMLKMLLAQHFEKKIIKNIINSYSLK
jgi:hypothetical protein